MSFDLKMKNGDLSIDKGQLEIVTGSDKLIQDILKIAITPAGANQFSLWYGSLIAKTLIGSSLDENIIVDAAKNQLTLALNTLQNLQSLQIQAFQKLTAGEQLAAIMNISVTRNPTDPRLFSVGIAALNRAFQRVQASFTVTPF